MALVVGRRQSMRAAVGTLAACTVVCLAAPAARAQQSSSNAKLSVSATVARSCTITRPGGVPPATPAPAGRGSMGVECARGVLQPRVDDGMPAVLPARWIDTASDAAVSTSTVPASDDDDRETAARAATAPPSVTINF